MKPTAIAFVLTCSAAAATAQLPDQLLRCRALADAATRLACYDALAVATDPAAPRTTSPAPPAPAAPADFGLPRPAAETAGQEVRSRVAPGFDGWKGSTRIALENGQVWEVVDGSSGYVGPGNRKVVVRRGALGSYRMEFEGSNNSPSVRRIR